MKYLFFLFFHALLFDISAQVDTLYLSGNKKDQVPKGDHYYYRIIEQIDSTEYYIRDFCDGHTLQLSAYSKSPDLSKIFREYNWYGLSKKARSRKVFETDTTGWAFYFNNDGLLSTKAQFVNNKKHGIVYYYNKHGSVVDSARTELGCFSGIRCPDRSLYDEAFEHFVYVQGIKKRRLKFFPNRKIASVGHYSSDDSPYVSWEKYYDETGKLIGDCHFAESKPTNGTYVEYFGIDYFVKKIIEYKDTMKISERTFNLHGEQIGYCDFIKGKPYNGDILVQKFLYSYNEGVREKNNIWCLLNGVKIHSYRDTTIEGIKNGISEFYHTFDDTVLIGYYRNGKPWKGFIYNKYELSYYIDGLKDGKSIKYNYDMDTIETSNYIKGVRHGTIINTEVSNMAPKIGIFQFGKPFNGSFISRLSPSYIERIYNEGYLIKEIKLAEEEYLLEYVKDYGDSSITIYRDGGKILLKGYLKNDKPYNGLFMEGDKGIATYVKGVKHGEKRYYDRFDDLIKLESYSNDILEGMVITYRLGSVRSKCYYRNGLPFEGYLKNNKNKLIIYQNGKMVKE